MLTTTDGPVVVSAKTLKALTDIRREKLLPQLYGDMIMSASNAASLDDVPDWLTVRDDAPQQELPTRVVAAAAPLEADTLRLALAIGASLILIDGQVKESAKLSFMKCEGAVSILVQAHREGMLTAVPPMIKALKALGHADVLPPPEAIEALYEALEHLQ